MVQVTALPPEAEALVQEAERRLADGECHCLPESIGDDCQVWILRDLARRLLEPGEKENPCDKCGKARTKAEGGLIFTLCDDCWGVL